MDGQLVGVVGLAVGFSRSISKYLLPLRNAQGRAIYLLSSSGIVLWPRGGELPAEEEAGTMVVTSRSFALGNETFILRGTETRESLKGEMASVDRIRNIVTILGTLFGLAGIYGIIRLYNAETRRSGLAEQERLLSERVKAREAELRESELLFVAMFEGAFDSILILDEGGTIVRGNQRACESLGAPGTGIIGSRLSLLSPGSQAEGHMTSAELEANELSRARSGEYPRFEWAHRAPDGGSVFFEVGLSSLRRGGACSFVAILRDISARKMEEKELRTALEDREILFVELHHRVRNNLQLMDSLIELQKSCEDPVAAGALAKAQSRLGALAASYLVTTESPEALRVDAVRYLGLIASLLKTEASANGVGLDVDLKVEALPLSLDMAVPIGLVLRELLLNMALHTYGPGGAGKAMVTFARKEGLAELLVTGEGKGLDPAAKEGLGLTLVRALVAQLGGSFSLEGSGGRVAALARFPLA